MEKLILFLTRKYYAFCPTPLFNHVHLWGSSHMCTHPVANRALTLLATFILAGRRLQTNIFRKLNENT